MAKIFSDSAARKIKLGAVKESWRMGRFVTSENTSGQGTIVVEPYFPSMLVSSVSTQGSHGPWPGACNLFRAVAITMFP